MPEPGYVARVALLSRLIERLAKLPPATHRLGRVERRVRVPMDDGVALLADVYHPAGAEPAPSVLMRSPYGRAFGALFGEAYARRGLRLVVESCRGTFGSGGVFRPQFDERADGLATLRWIGRQSWFDGRLAMSGPSYLGYVQWAIAADASPPVTALCPHITMSSLAAHWYAGGSFSLDDAIGWTAMVSGQERRFAGLARLFGTTARRVARHIDELPLLTLDERIVGRRVPFWRDFVSHASQDDPFWAPADHSKRVADVRAPVAMVSGWYDIFLPLQLADYRALAGAGNPPWLVIGPWTHTSLRRHGRAAPRFARLVRRAPARATARGCAADPVRLYVMGADEWRGFASWPPAGYAPERRGISTRAAGWRAKRRRRLGARPLSLRPGGSDTDRRRHAALRGRRAGATSAATEARARRPHLHERACSSATSR